MLPLAGRGGPDVSRAHLGLEVARLVATFLDTLVQCQELLVDSPLLVRRGRGGLSKRQKQEAELFSEMFR